MNISPTDNTSEIKKAFAHAAKLHHPEDDPEGFKIVKEAYRQAICCANRQKNYTIFSYVPPVTDSCGDVPAEYSEALHSNKEAENQKPSAQSEKLAEEEQKACDFDERIKRQNLKEEQHIRCVYNIARSIYDDTDKRNCASLWNKYFNSRDFLSLHDNSEFACIFLKFLIKNGDFTSAVWDKTFVPVLNEWADTSPSGEVSVLIDKLLQGHKKNKKAPVHLSKNLIHRRIAVAIILAFIILMDGLIYVLSANTDSNYNRNVQSSLLTTLSRDNYYSSKIAALKNMPYTDLIEIGNGIIDGNTYFQVDSSCKVVGLSEKEYNDFINYYKENGEDAFKEHYYNYIKIKFKNQ